ncbi:MAG: hypothetical protein K9G46_05915 [Flavobacteriales bacterium]|jgi:hypothetical protein|nr:hypothetical protein [Flavobacteriales bacterium]
MDTTQYLYRNVIFSKKGKTISLIDIDKPEIQGQELEPWFGVVLQLADGKHSVEDLFNFLSGQYSGNAPSNLKETVLSVVERLAESKLIVLTDKPTELPYYLSAPYEFLDIEKAKNLLKKHRANVN